MCILCSAPEAHADGDDVLEDLDELKDEITDADLCDVIESLLLDIPSADYPIVADTLPPRWIIGKNPQFVTALEKLVSSD